MGEDEIIVKETALYPYHTIRAGFNKLATAENADGTAIYGDADNTAIYGNAAGTTIYGSTATPDGNAPVIAANPTSDATTQTSDFAGIACAILALVALSAGITATRKQYLVLKK